MKKAKSLGKKAMKRTKGGTSPGGGQNIYKIKSPTASGFKYDEAVISVPPSQKNK